MSENSIFKKFAAAAVFAGALFSAGCPGAPDAPQTSQNNSPKNVNRKENMQNSPESNQDAVSTDIDELAKNVNLPVRPSQVVWKKQTLGSPEGAVPGPTDYLLIAVLEYDDAGVAALKEKLGQSGEESVKGIAEIKEWFPENVKKLAQNFDNEKLLSGEKFDAAAFARAPYLKGALLRVSGSNYFILTLFST